MKHNWKRFDKRQGHKTREFIVEVWRKGKGWFPWVPKHQKDSIDEKLKAIKKEDKEWAELIEVDK